jgi:hypothetical protein
MGTRRIGLAIAAVALVAAPATARVAGDYPLSADSMVRTGVARGRLEGPFEFRSAIFPGTVRRYWVQVPVGYHPARPPNLLVFQDGQRATNPEGSLRIPTVLDNLAARGEIPPTLGIYVTPGNLSAHYPTDLGMANPDHRAEEYDALGDSYARMLLEELLPTVAKRWRFSADPARRAIGGTSSGAVAAWTVAWHRPEAFGNVISFIGSYTSIGLRLAPDGTPVVYGADTYPGLIRKSPIRPLRVFLQDGSNDLDNEHGNWFLANQQMLAALTWANANADRLHDAGPRYAIEHVWGDGGHSDAHGGAILPDALRWLWRGQGRSGGR